MKLQIKLTMIFSVFLTVTFSIAAFIVSVRINDYNHRLTENLSTQLIESKANEAGAWLTQRIRELHTISRTPTVVAMEDEQLKKYITQLSNDMDSYYGNNYGTFSINRLDGLEYITENQTIDVSDRDYYKEVLTSNAEYVISKPIISKTDQSLITVACYPIFNESSEKIGFVAGAISLKKLTEITENILDYSIHCESKLYSFLLPKIIIQPLVENAIYHGIKPKLDKGSISVNVYEEQGNLMIEVKDDGIGIQRDELNNIRKNLSEHLSGNNYGLYNVNRRIYLQFGEGFGLTIKSDENTGTTATIRLPKMMEETCAK